MDTKIYLFAYGMLTNNEFMGEKPKFIAAGTLHDWDFEMLCYANVFPSLGKHVTGVLWEITDELLDQYDDNEGYPRIYTRKLVDISVGDNVFSAWVYTLTLDGRRAYTQYPASDNYIRCVTNGFEQHGITPPFVIKN